MTIISLRLRENKLLMEQRGQIQIHFRFHQDESKKSGGLYYYWYYYSYSLYFSCRTRNRYTNNSYPVAGTVGGNVLPVTYAQSSGGYSGSSVAVAGVEDS